MSRKKHAEKIKLDVIDWSKQVLEPMNKHLGFPACPFAAKWRKDGKLRIEVRSDKSKYEKQLTTVLKSWDKKQHDIKDGTKIEIDGKKMTHRSSLPKGSKAVNKKIDVFTAKLNKKLADAEKALKDKKKNESLDEQGVLSRRAGINVFGDRKLQLMAKGLRQSAFDLEKVAKRKDERNFDDILQRITITIGVIRSYLNKPKRSM